MIFFFSQKCTKCIDRYFHHFFSILLLTNLLFPLWKQPWILIYLTFFRNVNCQLSKYSHTWTWCWQKMSLHMRSNNTFKSTCELKPIYHRLAQHTRHCFPNALVTLPKNRAVQRVEILEKFWWRREGRKQGAAQGGARWYKATPRKFRRWWEHAGQIYANEGKISGRSGRLGIHVARNSSLPRWDISTRTRWATGEPWLATPARHMGRAWSKNNFFLSKYSHGKRASVARETRGRRRGIARVFLKLVK